MGLERLGVRTRGSSYSGNDWGVCWGSGCSSGNAFSTLSNVLHNDVRTAEIRYRERKRERHEESTYDIDSFSNDVCNQSLLDDWRCDGQAGAQSGDNDGRTHLEIVLES